MNAPTPTPDVVRTTCPYCGVGCGVLARVDGQGRTHIEGDPDHPANAGRLCSKGAALGETVSLEGRLLHPMLRMRNGAYERVSWDVALDATAEGISRTVESFGPDALAFYLSGQLLTEDYYVANKLMKGFFGSANVDTNSRLCMASSVAGYKRAFGGDIVPGLYADLDCADLIVLVGSNAAWCHPVLFQRMQTNRVNRGARIVMIDPRRTASAEDADLHLAIAPGMDSVLFAWLLQEIVRRGALATDYIAAHTSGLDAALESGRAIAPDIGAVARRCNITAADIMAFCDLWIETPRVVTAWSQGVNQSAQGTDKVNAIINCHLATGRIGKPGMSPFSLTGQPNAMGGREVGGLANMLAAHMGFTGSEVDRVGRFWKAPKMARREGLKAVDMFDAIAAGSVRALWVMATNPAVSMPKADAVRAALGRLDFFAISEVLASNDTLNSGAHVLLPAAAWGEKDGAVTNSERRISRQRPFLALPGEVRPDWWIICEIARRLGFGEAFAFDGPAAIFREHAALSAFENDGARAFDIGALAACSDSDYAGAQPALWPQRADGVHTTRWFSEGKFLTPDGRARFVAVKSPECAVPSTPDFPLLLNTGRVRDHWHTMTRTGRSPRLAAHTPEPFLAVNLDDAIRFGLRDGAFAEVTSACGEAVLRLRIDDAIMPGEVFAPIHWSDATSSHGRVGALVNDRTDPFSGQPELKATPVRVKPRDFASVGALAARTKVNLPAGAWWSLASLPDGAGYRLATDDPDGCAAWFRSSFEDCEIAEMQDAPRGILRLAAFRNGALEAALFLAADDQGAAWDAVRQLLATTGFDPLRRRLALSGGDAGDIVDAGPMICACFGVARGAITSAVEAGTQDIVAIGAQLRAGTNCGSCLPEIRRIIADARVREPAIGHLVEA